jgi:hypothetical protein
MLNYIYMTHYSGILKGSSPFVKLYLLFKWVFILLLFRKGEIFYMPKKIQTRIQNQTLANLQRFHCR